MATTTKRRKQRETWGRVRKLPSGRYQASYEGPDLKVHAAPSTFQALDDARAWLRHERRLVEADQTGGTPWLAPKARRAAEDDAAAQAAAGAVTLREYATRTIALRQLKSTTKEDYTKLLDRYIFPKLGDLPVAGIGSAEVRGWWEARDAKLARSNAKAYILLRSIMNDAVDDEDVPLEVNPCRIKGAAQVKASAKAPEATVDEVAAMADAMPAHLRCIVLLGAWCSLRYSEIVALQRRDIDVKNRAVRIQRNATWDGSAESTTKTTSSTRVVHIPLNVWPDVAEHLEHHTGKERTALLFPPARGVGYLRESVFYRSHWKDAREAAGRPDLRFHDLRGTGATWAAQAGVPLLEIQHRLGHATPDATLIYLRKAHDGDQRAAARLAAMVAPAEPAPRLRALPDAADVDGQAAR